MTISQSLNWIHWDPPREAFNIPYVDHPVVWYGILFVAGFLIAYTLILKLFTRYFEKTNLLAPIDILNWDLLFKTFYISTDKSEALKTLNKSLSTGDMHRNELSKSYPQIIASCRDTAQRLTDRLCWLIIAGTVIGARLGEVFFYDWPYFKANPWAIIEIWHGGLSSHGGIIGVALAITWNQLWIRRNIPTLSFLKMFDFIAVVAPIVLGLIRIGNFVNQEIVGTVTDVPWAVIFGHPVEGEANIPRHPVQLYEALVYFAIFALLWTLWKRKKTPGDGFYFGLVLTLGFSSRFIIEFWKETQISFMDPAFLQMGQLLSLPFIALGVALIFFSLTPKSRPASETL